MSGTRRPGSAALFVGLSVLDVFQRVERLPTPDEKVDAADPVVQIPKLRSVV